MKFKFLSFIIYFFIFIQFLFIDVNYIFAYSVSGYITDTDSNPITGVTVTLSDINNNIFVIISSTITGNDGSYQFTGLTGNGNYKLDVTGLSYSFIPASISTYTLSGNISGYNFIGSTMTYLISGHTYFVINNGVYDLYYELTGVTMTMSGDINSTTITTDKGYSFNNLPFGGNYTIAPTKTYYTFSPSSKTINSIDSNKPYQNFLYYPLPVPYVSDELLDFGMITVGKSKKMSFTIEDLAKIKELTQVKELTGTILKDMDWISVSSETFSGDLNVITVTANTNGLSQGKYSGKITIKTDVGPVFTINVKVNPTCVISSPNPFIPGYGKNLVFRGSGVLNGRIFIYNLTGELLKELNETNGKNEIEWDGYLDNGKLIESGIFFYTATNPREPTGNKGYFTVRR